MTPSGTATTAGAAYGVISDTVYSFGGLESGTTPSVRNEVSFDSTLTI